MDDQIDSDDRRNLICMQVPFLFVYIVDRYIGPGYTLDEDVSRADISEGNYV